MAKLTRYQSFRATFKENKDAQPLGGDSASWDEYFLGNPGKVMAGALALHKLGESVVIKAQGAPYADAKMQEQSFERVMSSLGRSTGRKARHLFDTREDLAQARGEKYLKMLKAFLRRFPVDLNHITEPEQPVQEAVLSA